MTRTPLAPRDPDPRPGTPALETRTRIAAAAFDLFAAQGYDGTTVDAIAERAGIARRTFFRYFRSKDDVIFPDHDLLLATVLANLADQAAASPVVAICSGVRLVFRSYVADPTVSVQRYRLTRRVDALRDRELASVRKYERAFSRYLRERLAGAYPEAEVILRSDVIAASVVASHNAVLREWLRSGGDYDPMADLETAFAWVIQTFEPQPRALQRQDGSAGSEPGSSSSEADGSDVVVAVFRADQPIGDVVERISRSL
jgi:AcrR family transcriptional regulator